MGYGVYLVQERDIGTDPGRSEAMRRETTRQLYDGEYRLPRISCLILWRSDTYARDRITRRDQNRGAGVETWGEAGHDVQAPVR